MNSKVRLLVQAVFCLSFMYYHINVSAQVRGVVYEIDSTNFPNPERGIYHHKEVRSSNYLPLTFNELTSYREHGVTLVMRVFYLESFVESDISNEYLEHVDRDFETARSAGVKLLVRFAYTQEMTKPYGDATPERVLAHIKQLTPVLRKNSDVIALVQAGFIGGWGEWFYTDHFSQVAGFNNPQNWLDRKAVVDALLEALPENRTVQLRTPAYKRTLTGITEPLDSAEAYSGSMSARLGHHNDCFLASHNDLGTYVDIEEEKAYIEQETYYVPLGGETCGVYVPRSECPNALAEMARLHWSYLNEDYHPLVISGFESEGCMPDIRKLLGYRFRLIKSNVQETSKPGGEFHVSMELVNDGWARPFNPRDVEIVLTNTETNAEYFFKVPTDPRRWSLDETIHIDEVVGVPDDFLPGNYQVSLNLPDPEISLSQLPSFSIRLANKNVWDPATGYNMLGVEVNIDSENQGNDFTGENYLVQRHVQDNSIVLTDFYVSASDDEVMLYWPTRSDGFYRVIERSIDGGEYLPIRTLLGEEVFFKDQNVTGGSVYAYRYRFTDGNRYSMYSPAASGSLSAVEQDYPIFNVDGNISEWSATEPLAGRHYDGENYFLRLFAERDSLNILLEGGNYSHYAVFLDTDNQSSGIAMSTWPGSGFDYRVQNDSLFRSENSDWVYVSRMRGVFNDSVREIKVPLSALLNLGDNIILKTGLALVTSDGSEISLPKEGLSALTYTRSFAAAVPQELRVSNSEADPKHRLIIEWSDECNGCEGFVLERSLDGEAFETLFKTPSATIYRDDSLEVNTTYYYRLYAYNETGPSNYTPVSQGTTTEVVTGVAEDLLSIDVFPNPVKDKIYISGGPKNFSVEIRTGAGNSMLSKMITQAEGASDVSVDVSTFPIGFYLLSISQPGSRTQTIKIVKTQ